MTYELLHGDCLEVMAAMDAGSVDAVCTDPPYGLGFMGKAWDSFDQDAVEASWSGKGRQQGCKSVPLPSGTARTGVGFRKPNPRCGVCGRAMNGRDTAKGFKVCHCENPVPVPVPNRDAERFQMAMTEWAGECWRVLKPSHYLLAFGGTRTWHRLACAIEDAGFEIRDTLMWLYGSGFPKGKSCLKPAWEPVILARKPGPKRALGIEECRVGTTKAVPASVSRKAATNVYGEFSEYGETPGVGGHDPNLGRYPANLILDEEAGAMLDGQTGTLTTQKTRTNPDADSPNAGIFGVAKRQKSGPEYLGDSGGASRFFYCAKASRSERNAGCEGMPLRGRNEVYGDGMSTATKCDPNMGHTPESVEARPQVANHHPTVKPLALMRWLVKLVAQPGDVVLDPFMGSGTTGVACAMEGREFIGIEREAEYIEIARRRIEAASAQERLPLDESPPFPPGRWPANLILDSEAAAMLDAQAPNSGGGSKDSRGKAHWDPATHRDSVRRDVFVAYPDSGGASRFFFRADYDESDVPVE